MNKENNYIIYKVENKENGQVYIGATTNSLTQRKLDHVERANRSENGKFQEAISTYGTEAFTWEQIDTVSSTDELAKREKEFIYKYNSKNEGYNSDEGGGFKKTVYQYNLIDGSLFKTYDCLTDAGNAINATKQDISRACLSVNKICGDFYWSYEFKEPFTSNLDSRKKIVLQFTKDEELIAEYNSVAEASRKTNINKSCIAKVCRQEREYSGGYKWKYN